MSVIDRLRRYLDEHPELRGHLAEWVEDYLLDQMGRCFGWLWTLNPMATYLVDRCENFIQQAALDRQDVKRGHFRYKSEGL